MVYHRDGTHLKCLKIKRFKSPIRNISIKDNIIVVCDTRHGIHLLKEM